MLVTEYFGVLSSLRESTSYSAMIWMLLKDLLINDKLVGAGLSYDSCCRYFFGVCFGADPGTNWFFFRISGF